ncbi:hypothetical protein GCM10008905_02760 [Clostridium malenominatum]|uniref:Phage protein n=1 Tax=Clostridium malenominatum TaxID=1539 RepID=A0ABN1IM76_9CLOT
MNRGSLILYDNIGKVWLILGDSEGVLPYTLPVGIPYIETQFGELDGKIVKGVDISANPHKLILEDVNTETEEQRLQRELLEAQETIINLEYEKLTGGI